jgi:putative aldouronate transport system substrate-binding protein
VVTQVDDESVVKAKLECIIPFLEQSKQYVLPGSMSFSSEDDAVRREAMTDITTYVKEMAMKFVCGRESLDNWDAYVAKVQEMGIDDVLAIYQNTLDAWNAQD